MNAYIITGASRGLGEALARQLMFSENILFCISRSVNNDLVSAAQKKGTILEFIKFDLNDISQIDSVMKRIFTSMEKFSIDGLYLINNAGILGPVMPLDKCTSDQILNNFSINSIAPMVLTSSFIRNSEKMSVDKKVVNISSGAGKKPKYGWSCYCSSKAAVDMFTRCVGLEQEKRENPVTIISFAPGIIDTDMQKEIRSSKEENFSELQRFINFKKEGKLLEPSFVASKVIELLRNKKIAQGSVLDISQI